MAFAPSEAELRAMDQTQMGLRRRRMLRTFNGGSFVASREIAEQATPLAQRIASQYAPPRYRLMVVDFVNAVAEFVFTVVGWITEGDAKALTAHLVNEPGARQRAMRLIADLAQRPEMPEITPEMLNDGSWAVALAAMAEPLDAPLSDLLARAHPPEADALRGQLSRSERLDKLLRETIDMAALTLSRKIDKAAAHPTSQPPASEPDRARAELKKLGVQL